MLSKNMEEENFIEELDKKRRIFYYGGIAAVVFSFLILYIFVIADMLVEKPGLEEEITGNSQVAEVGEGQEDGIYHVEVKTKDDCLDMDDKNESRKCLDNIALDSAIDDNLFSKCNDIGNESLRNDCMHQVAHNQESITLCLKISDEEIKKTCVSDVAISLKDPSVCSAAFRESFELKECRDVATAFTIAYSGKKDDIGECAAIETKEYSNLCFLNSYVSKYGGDCEKIPSAYRQYCIDYKAMEAAKNPEDCDVVKDFNYKEYCLKVAEVGVIEARYVDTDGDGITDGNELFMKTDPKKVDTDGDGINDGAEWIILGTDPGNPDTDGDGLNDSQEMQDYHTNPKNPDTDGDNRNDGLEVKMKKNPLTKD